MATPTAGPAAWAACTDHPGQPAKSKKGSVLLDGPLFLYVGFSDPVSPFRPPFGHVAIRCGRLLTQQSWHLSCPIYWRDVAICTSLPLCSPDAARIRHGSGTDAPSNLARRVDVKLWVRSCHALMAVATPLGNLVKETRNVQR